MNCRMHESVYWNSNLAQKRESGKSSLLKIISTILLGKVKLFFNVQFQLIFPPINIFKRLNNTRAMYKHFLSHKLRCYTGICGSEKSRNNTQEKISYFFTCVDIADQPHLPLVPLGQVDEWTAKPSRFSIQVVCRSFFELCR